MADETDYALLREDVGVSATKLDDTKAAAIFTEAEAKYPSNEDALFAYARVRALQKLWAQSIEEDVDYVQNEESEKLGRRVDNRQELLDYWQAKLDTALAEAERPKGQAAMVFTAAGPTRRSCTLW